MTTMVDRVPTSIVSASVPSTPRHIYVNLERWIHPAPTPRMLDATYVAIHTSVATVFITAVVVAGDVALAAGMTAMTVGAIALHVALAAIEPDRY